MALMTSCPACNSRFRVVPDQLRLHHGLVRCGTCDHVFDANTRLEAMIEQLSPGAEQVDPADTPEAWFNKPAVLAMAGTQQDPLHAQTQATQTTVKSSVRSASRHASKGVMSSQNAGGEVTLTPLSADEKLQITQNTGIGQFESSERYSHVDDIVAIQQAAEQQAERRKRRAEKKRAQAALDAQATLALDDKSKEALSANEPDSPGPKNKKSRSKSLVKLKTAHIWQMIAKWLTRLLTAGAVLAALLQLLLLSRLSIANILPVAKPVLTQMCQLAACSIEPASWLQPLSLDALTLTKPNSANNTTFAMPAAGMQTYRLQATVRNSSTLEIKKPDIELTISNLQGTVIARKTLTAQSLSVLPTQTSVSSPYISTIKSGNDWLIDAALQLDEQTVGYTARVVYLP